MSISLPFRFKFAVYFVARENMLACLMVTFLKSIIIILNRFPTLTAVWGLGHLKKKKTANDT